MGPLNYSCDWPAVDTGTRDGTLDYEISTREQNAQAPTKVDFDMTKGLRLRLLKSCVPLSHQGNTLERDFLIV